MKGVTCYYVQGGHEGLTDKVTLSRDLKEVKERSCVVMGVGESFPGRNQQVRRPRGRVMIGMLQEE